MKNSNKDKEYSLVLPNGTKLGGLTDSEKRLLEILITRSFEGEPSSREQIKEDYGADGVYSMTVSTMGRKISLLNEKLLWETNYVIDNTAPQLRVKAAYIFRERTAEEERKKQAIIENPPQSEPRR
ncbi:MAG: hypothetical protein AAB600_03950 [Patescibacteria group bacterium]